MLSGSPNHSGQRELLGDSATAYCDFRMLKSSVQAGQTRMSVAHDMSGLINTRYVRFCRSGQGARCMHELLPDGRYGADDEDPRSDLASFGEEDYLVASSRDHGDHGPTDAAVALAVQGDGMNV